MKDIKLFPMNLETDKAEIEGWDTLYAQHKNYQQIYKFILEDGLINGLGELIYLNYEQFPIGRNERKFSFVARNENGKIVGFLILSAYELQTSSPEMFVQYIVLNPKYQNHGYGTGILHELFSNFKKYIGVKPKQIFSYIHQDNIASQKLFKHFGFDLAAVPKSDYFCASTDGKSLKQTIESQNQKI